MGGSGLGMSICKQIVEIHGGNILAANASLGGLLITIELPLNEILCSDIRTR
jgi:signal transduction histidine kinase